MTSLASLCGDFRGFGKPQMSQSLIDTGAKEKHTVVVALIPNLSGNQFSRVSRQLQTGGNEVSMSSPEPWNTLMKQSFQGEGDVSAMYILCVNMGIYQSDNCCELQQSWKYGSNKRNVTQSGKVAKSRARSIARTLLKGKCRGSRSHQTQMATQSKRAKAA